MAGIIPNIPNTGNKIPGINYTAAVTESFPNVNKTRNIESSINSREKVDFMPVNMGVNQVLTDKYVEFRINGIVGSFIDLGSLILELAVKPTKPDLSNLDDDTNITVPNGLSNTLFKSVAVYLNEKVVENNSMFNVTSYLKQLKTLQPQVLDTLGKCGAFYDDINGSTGVTNNYIANKFTDDTLERKRMSSIKSDGIYTYFPLLLDISTIDMYLLDGVDIRIRLELASNDFILKSDTAIGATLQVKKIKLWVDRVTPQTNALLAFNKVLSLRDVNYIYTNTLSKTYIVGSNENSIMIDQPFGTCIPEKLTMVFIDMNAFSGRGNQNGLYFDHCHLSNTHITVNGNTVYNINTDFPHDYAHSYYETQKALGLDSTNLISHDSYSKGRSIFCFNFLSERVEESLPVEVSASLRINLKFAQNIPSPRVILLLADTTGILNINYNRTITCDVRG